MKNSTNKKVLICVVIALFFQAWPVLNGFYQARTSVIFSEPLSDIKTDVYRKDIFPKKTGSYILEVFNTTKPREATAPSQIAPPTISDWQWTFGSQGKVLNQGQGLVDLKMNSGQIYTVEVNVTSAKSQVPENEHANTFLRLSYNQVELLQQATNQYIFGTVVSLIFLGLAVTFWVRREKEPAR